MWVFHCTSSAIWSARVCRSASSLRMSDSSAMMTAELWLQTRKTAGGERERQREREWEVSTYKNTKQCKEEDFGVSVGGHSAADIRHKQHIYTYSCMVKAPQLWSFIIPAASDDLRGYWTRVQFSNKRMNIQNYFVVLWCLLSSFFVWFILRLERLFCSSRVKGSIVLISSYCQRAFQQNSEELLTPDLIPFSTLKLTLVRAGIMAQVGLGDVYWTGIWYDAWNRCW